MRFSCRQNRARCLSDGTCCGASGCSAPPPHRCTDCDMFVTSESFISVFRVSFNAFNSAEIEDGDGGLLQRLVELQDDEIFTGAQRKKGSLVGSSAHRRRVCNNAVVYCVHHFRFVYLVPKIATKIVLTPACLQQHPKFGDPSWCLGLSADSRMLISGVIAP